MPQPDRQAAIVLAGDRANRFEQGAYEVWVFSGHCELTQGRTRAAGKDAVFWVDRHHGDGTTKVIAYFEGNVVVDHGHSGQTHAATGQASGTETASNWLGRFYSDASVEIRAAQGGATADLRPAIYDRGLAVRRDGPTVQPTQFVPTLPPGFESPQFETIPPGSRQVQILPRSGVRPQIRSFPSADGSQVVVISSGVNIIVEDVRKLGKLDIETDRVVIWTKGIDGLNFSGKQVQQEEVPLEFYMEGNIVFRQADRVIYADRMYYNVAGQYGAVLGAEMLTPVPSYQGLLRLKADVLQQLDAQHFIATGAALTSSRLGVPRYWIQSRTIEFEDIQHPVLDPSGMPIVDPATGDTAVEHELTARSSNNFLYYGGLPVFYWPTIKTDLTDPNFYVNRVRVGTDKNLGTQFMVDWNVYQLLGLERPSGHKWWLATDYFSERGPAVGTSYSYQRDGCLGIMGPTNGNVHAWGIYDEGLDYLGRDRRGLVPDTKYRGRIRWRHQHQMQNGFQLYANVDAISDYNFLNQYYEREWKDSFYPASGLQLKQLYRNQSWSILADYRLNDFFTQTSHLPRFDHYLVGQSLFGDRLRWHAHTHAEYAQLRTAALGNADMGDPLIWERPNDAALNRFTERRGFNVATRHEIDAPVQLGPVKAVPYALGEVAHWQEDRAGNDVTRLYGQFGLRTSLPFVKVMPDVRNEFFNLNGLAHKISLDSDTFYADANRDMDGLALYNRLDDESVEAFERRFYLPSSGLDLTLYPPNDDRFDPRHFAHRYGMQSWVTTGNTEIVEDHFVQRWSLRQRWQTKRGLPGQERIVDWIVFDTSASLFFEPDRDNSGETVGMIDYNFRWHLGDRFTVLSDGYFDVFDLGLKTVSFGTVISRPGRGRVYVGMRSYEGPISSNLLLGSVSYRMSEKWITQANATVNLDKIGNNSQSLRFVRIGESLLISLGFSYQQARDNVGLHFAIEPRFLPRTSLGNVAGVTLPPAGAYGLE